VQLVEDLGAYSEELFDRQWPVSKQQRLAEATLVGGHRPGRAAFGQAEAEAQKGDIGRFSLGVDAGALDRARESERSSGLTATARSQRSDCRCRERRGIWPDRFWPLRSSALDLKPAGGSPCLGSAAATEEQRVTTVENALRILTLGVGPKGEPGSSYSRGRRRGWRSPCGATCTGVGSLKHRTEVHIDV